MSSSHYTDNELHLMSYPDLRRLSTLLQLPANIKKKYMISMIQAHQKGDCCMKTAIANKIMEERKVKKLNNKKKQSKSFNVGNPDNSQEIPTNVSVSAQHEFETRFSYVAHYSKDEISSGISRIIKQEAEVSRRNRSILQHSKKPTRKLAAVGRTEIMLPRNHSLTTPVRLMPQYERGFPSSGDYEAMPGLSNAKNHFQDLNCNYQFHGEISNALIPTTSHELYRNEPYWHTREMYNNSLMPILSSLLTPSSVTINSSSYASQYTSSNSVKGTTSFQGVYENYIKSNSIIESQAFQSSVTNSSTLIVNNHHVINNSSSNNAYNSTAYNRGSYLYSKENVDYEISSTASELNCEQCNRDCSKRDRAVRNSSGNPGLLDFYPSRNLECAPQALHITAIRSETECSNVCFPTENKNVSLPPASHHPFESSIIAYKTTEIVSDHVATDVSDHENVPPVIEEYESSYAQNDKLWEESENGMKRFIRKDQIEKENLENSFLTSQSQGSLLSDVSDASTSYFTETELQEKQSKANENESLNFIQNFPRCPYTLGHNKYPEAVTDSNKITNLPSFLSTFCSNEYYSKAYSMCKNSFTGTTETHLNPIMTSTCALQFSSHTNSQQAQVNNSTGGTQIQRQWCYTYPESQGLFSLDSGTYPTWNDEMDSNVGQNNHNVRIVKCRTHGCHYLYSVSTRCE